VYSFHQLATTLAFTGSRWPTFFTGLVLSRISSARLAALHLSRRHRGHGLGCGLGARAPGGHAVGRRSGSSRRHPHALRRSAVIDVIRLDYVNTARAKGLSEASPGRQARDRNALIPVVTLVALQIPYLHGRRHHRQIFPHPRHRLAADSSILANERR